MLNPELLPFLKDWEAAWSVLPANATPAERRTLFEYITARMRPPTPDNVVSSVRYVTAEKRNVLVRIDSYAAEPRKPCLVYMHGGAFMQGSPLTHSDITGLIAATNRQVVVSVDYALSPEHVFPQAINECLDAVRWVRDNAESLGIDGERIAVGGDSAGGNLAAAVAIALRGTPYAPMAQLLIYPAVDFEMDKPSYIENADAPLLNTRGMPAVNAAYCPNPEDRRNPLAAPMFAQNHAGLPPAFIGVAQNDPLRDDGYAYADKLRAAGVPVEFDTGEGMIHGYMRALTYCSGSRERLQRMCQWLSATYASVS